MNKEIKPRKLISIITLLLSTIILSTILFQKHSEYQRQEAFLNHPESTLKYIPFYQTIAKHNPELYKSIITLIKSSKRNNLNQNNISRMIRDSITPYIASRVPFASNSAIMQYMNVTVQEIEILKNESHTLCYNYLYATKNTAVNVSDYISHDILAKDLKAATQVIKSSYEHKNNSITINSNVINNIMKKLHKTYGEDIALLNSPIVSNHNQQKKICLITIDLFKNILTLPTNEGGNILRYLSVTKANNSLGN